jgi:hypothetical protein
LKGRKPATLGSAAGFHAVISSDETTTLQSVEQADLVVTRVLEPGSEFEHGVVPIDQRIVEFTTWLPRNADGGRRLPCLNKWSLPATIDTPEPEKLVRAAMDLMDAWNKHVALEIRTYEESQQLRAVGTRPRGTAAPKTEAGPPPGFVERAAARMRAAADRLSREWRRRADHDELTDDEKAMIRYLCEEAVRACTRAS